MFGNLGELAGMMKNLQNIQSQAKKMKEELAALEITGRSSCGQVEVTMSGDMILKKVSISPELVALNNHVLVQTSVHEAVANAMSQVKQAAASRLSAATGGMNLPGLF